jgi:hypothetical protein
MLYSLDIVADYAGSKGKQDGDELREIFKSFIVLIAQHSCNQIRNKE